MKLRLAALTGVAAALLFATPAHATDTIPVESDCLTGWYVNGDETDRKPESTEDGFTFEGADLIHHATQIKLENLEAGSYVADPAPDQPSFFSVEIRDGTTGAYGTLRWNGTAWTLTTNVDTFTETDPVEFAGVMTKWGEITEDAMVVSFGVGYTANPPGTVATVVSSVTFNGETFDLTCKPEASPSATASPSASPSASASATSSPAASSTTNPAAAGDQPTLPKTGFKATDAALIGGVVVVLGVFVYAAARRRRRRFEP